MSPTAELIRPLDVSTVAEWADEVNRTRDATLNSWLETIGADPVSQTLRHFPVAEEPDSLTYRFALADADTPELPWDQLEGVCPRAEFVVSLAGGPAWLIADHAESDGG